MSKGLAVLAFSGGLDTSVMLHWLLNKGYVVAAYTADLGQGDRDLQQVREKALKIGAQEAYVDDLKREFVVNYVFPSVRANAKYEGIYLLGTSFARPATAKGQVEYGKKLAQDERFKNLGPPIFSHGATGKGNDQVRFELAYLTLYPECKVYAPWKDPEFREEFKDGRISLLAYAGKNGVEVKQTISEPWSSDENLAHISYEAGMLENPNASPFKRMFQITRSIEDAPNEPTYLELDFEKGNPVRVRRITHFRQEMEIEKERGLLKDVVYDEEKTDPVDLFLYLNEVAGENGIGRLDIVENRYVGMKSRGVYESPGLTVLHMAHRDLEGITLDREVMRRNQHTSIDLAERIYSGFWFSPERNLMQQDIDRSQEVVSGTVRAKLFKGNVIAMGRSSSYTLYDEGIASMNAEGGFDQTKSRGFIDVTALRLQVGAKRDAKRQL